MKKKAVRYAEGAKIEGDTHAQDGVNFTNGADGSDTILEGGERVFSVEDTEEMERLSASINQAEGEDKTELASVLGHKVSKMIAAQDQRQDTPTDDDFLINGTDEEFDEPTEFID